MASESHPFKFICLSMDGLDQNKKSWFMNRNIKGRMERELSKMDRPDSVDGMQTPTCCESLLTCLLKGHVIGLQQHLGLDSGLRKSEERRD